jgi:3-oxoacyl-ACP reductase-like protein
MKVNSSSIKIKDKKPSRHQKKFDQISFKLKMIKISIILFIIFASVSAHDIINEFKNANNFTGKVVLVTESTSDMGEIIVKLFSSLGAKVVVTGSNETRLIKVAEDVTHLSPHGFKVFIYLSEFCL